MLYNQPIKKKYRKTIVTSYKFDTLNVTTVTRYWFGFYGISTIVGYLMQNSEFTNIWFVNISMIHS